MQTKLNPVKKTTLLFSSCICFLAINSCRKGDNASWDVNALTPLVKTSMDINNLIADSLIQMNGDSSLKIVYENNFFKFNTDSLFQIPDTTLDTSFTSPIQQPFTAGQSILPGANQDNTFSVSTVQLTKSIIRSGKLILSATNGVQGPLELDFKIPSATLNSIPFDKAEIVPAKVGSTPGTFTKEYDLKDYVIDMRGMSGNKFNTVVTYVGLKAAANLTVNAGDNVTIKYSFVDIVPQYAKGYFGQTTTVIGPDVTDFPLFKKITSGTLKIEDIDVSLSLENSIGVDAKATLTDFTSINTHNNSQVTLQHAIMNNPILLNRAVDVNSIVTPYTYSVTLNPNNSNIKNLIENLPTKLRYALKVEINPLGNVSGGNDFVYYDKLMKASLNMTMPLSLVATNLTLQDTLGFDGAGNVSTDIHSGNLVLYANNGFPFDASVQLYLLDDNKNQLGVLMPPVNTIDEAPLDSQLKVMQKKLTKLVIPVSDAMLEALRHTKSLRMVVKFNTSSQPNYVKIYSGYSIDLQLVGDFGYTVHAH